MSIHVDPPSGGEEVNVPVFPNPDVVQLKRFVDVLFKHAERSGFVSLRAFTHRDALGPDQCELLPRAHRIRDDAGGEGATKAPRP